MHTRTAFAILAMIALITAASSAEPPQAAVIDYTCQGQRLSAIVVAVRPSTQPRILEIDLDHTACLPPGTGS